MIALGRGRFHIRFGRHDDTGKPLWIGWLQVEIGEHRFYADIN